MKFDGDIYIAGNGIDKMLTINEYIKEGFIKFSSNNYTIDSDKDLDLTINKSLLTSFSNVMDIIAK